jgi:hypothetical protein
MHPTLVFTLSNIGQTILLIYLSTEESWMLME